MILVNRHHPLYPFGYLPVHESERLPDASRQVCKRQDDFGNNQPLRLAAVGLGIHVKDKADARAQRFDARNPADEYVRDMRKFDKWRDGSDFHTRRPPAAYSQWHGQYLDVTRLIFERCLVLAALVRRSAQSIFIPFFGVFSFDRFSVLQLAHNTRRNIAQCFKSIIFNTPTMLMVYGVAATILCSIRRALAGGDSQTSFAYGFRPFQLSTVTTAANSAPLVAAKTKTSLTRQFIFIPSAAS